MSKVLKGFYCTQEKKSYSVGDEYTGKRTDLGDRVEAPKKKKASKDKVENKALKTEVKNK